MLLLSSTLVLLLAGSALASIDSPRPMMAESLAGNGWEPSELPDVAVVVSTDGNGAGKSVIGANETPRTQRLAAEGLEQSIVPQLGQLPGVLSVTAEDVSPGRVALFISIDDANPDLTLKLIETTIQRAAPELAIAVGGRAVADRDLLDRLNRGTLVAVVPVLVLLTILAAASFGPRFGLGTGAAVSTATLLSGIIGSRMVGPFDGSLGSTALPAVLVSLLVATVLCFRLLDWFKQPEGDDQAQIIQNAVRHLLPEALLLFAGLVLTAVVLGLAGPGRTPATVVAVGAFVGALITFAVLPAILVALPPVPDEDDFRMFRLHVPDGRDFPTAVLAGFALFLLAIGLFAVRVPSSELMDESSLPEGVMSRRVSEQLAGLGGDPTSAVLVTANAESSDRDLTAWARSASLLPGVGWVETAVGRYTAGELVTPAASGATFQSDDGQLIIVTPNVTARSAAAQALVVDLAAIEALEVELSGAPVDAQRTASDALSHLWLLVLCLALAGGTAVYILTSDLRLAMTTVLLRVLGTSALLGVYTMVSGSASAVELHVAALTMSVGVGLFELGFIRRLTSPAAQTETDMINELLEPSPRPDPVGAAFRQEGRAAMLGLGITALTGLGFLASDLEMARRLGVAIAAGVVIELLIGIWMLRPVLMGRFAPGATSVAQRRSARLALNTLDEEETLVVNEDELLDPAWRRVVAGLLRAEFAFQNDPTSAELTTVFVEDTPVFGELAAHNRRLREAGFRVTGQGPRLLKVRAVNSGSPVTLAITVDHPERKLVDRDGRLLGVRRAERRDGMLWLVQDPSGRYRIAEAVDLGTGDIETVVAETPVPLNA